MRHHLTYICLLLLLLAGSCGQRRSWEVSLRKDKKEPYDNYLAYRSLPYYFPEASLSDLPGGFDYLNINTMQSYGQQGHSLLVLTGKSLRLSEGELKELISFTGQGNEIFIACSYIDSKLERTLQLRLKGGTEYHPLSKDNPGKDNINVLQLDSLPGMLFGMNGRSLRSSFRVNDSSVLSDTESYEIGPVSVLGRVKDSLPNFIRYRIGNGHLTLHASPLVLTNYFLLQPGNKQYLEQIWQSIPGRINTVYWAGFHTRAPANSSFDILLRHPATRWFLLISLLTLALYVLFQLKRRQRIIPVITRPQNSSAAFVETVGMLYFNKGNNANLALKMIQHFLEWVRSNYFLNTNNINDIFAEQLSIRSGLPASLATELTSLIHEVRLGQQVSDGQLYRLYSLIQQFYKTRAQ